ncbi:MAG TPA: ComF family protein [Chloroflexia bacterium]|nr:ComF family protein [Chloroflexia bacterium]
MHITAKVVAGGAWTLLLDTFYPPRCGGCDRRGTWLCAECDSLINDAPPRGEAVPRLAALVCAGAFVGPLREAVHKLKYECDTPLARPLAGLLSGALERDGSWVDSEGEAPVLVPVPLHPSRQRGRGYNQALLIARELGTLTGWPVRGGLVRVRDTRSQVGLSPEERAANVRDAFEWRDGQAPAFAMLVDDVCTTGATLSECAFALTSLGTRRVTAAVVARAVSAHPNADAYNR